MAASKTNPPTTNLATLLLIKRKLSAKNESGSNTKPTPPAPVIGAHSNEKITYHQTAAMPNPADTTTTDAPTNATNQSKATRKTKQLEIGLLDKKMEEINRKQEVKTNEALDTWKGFDSLNYGFTPTSGTRRSTPVQPVAREQRAPTPPPKRELSPVKEQPAKEQPLPVKQQSAKEQPLPVKHQSAKEQPPSERLDSPVKEQPSSERVDSPVKEQPPSERVDSPIKEQPLPVKQQSAKEQPPPERVDSLVKDQPRPKSPPKEEEEPRKETPAPSLQPTNHEEPSSSPPPPPLPPPRRSKVKSPELEEARSEPPTSVIENIVPFSAAIADPQIFQKNVQPVEKPTGSSFKVFPDIKQYQIRKPRHALKSIQRSMDRYRFHVW